MMQNRRNRRANPCFIVLGLLCAACAAIPTLEVRYQSAAPTRELTGRKAVLRFQDARGEVPFLGDGAGEAFRNFPGDFYFSVIDPAGSEVRFGLYGTEEMMKEAFTRKMKAAGMEVLSEAEPGAAEIEIVLKDFQLDLVHGYWTGRMEYDARLLKGGDVRATQSITGQVQRLKWVGREGADRVVSEIFTDAVNQLDLQKLFRDGRLQDY